MALGGAAKKIQTVTDRAEQLYQQVQELQQRIIGLEEAVDETHDSVKTLEHSVAEQRALLVALAQEQGIDVDQVLTETAIEEAESTIVAAEAETDEDGTASGAESSAPANATDSEESTPPDH